MGSLYVGNLDPDCTEAVLYRKFVTVGNLLNIRLCRKGKTGRCLGYGYINYASESDAQIALSTLNYTSIKGRTIRLMRVEKNIKKLPSNANVFIKNLDSNIDERSLYDIFSNYGDILSLKVAKDEKGFSKGYAFIQFQDEKSAEDAIRNIDQKMLRGKVVTVTKFLPKGERLKQNIEFQNVYIKNFASEIKDEDLVDMCKKFGEILSAKIMLDQDGNSKCFGFVCFKNPDSAKEAVKELNGKNIDGRRLFADRAKKKDERQKEIKENFKRRLECPESNCLLSVSS